MELARLGWDRLVGSLLLVIGLVITFAASGLAGAPPPPREPVMTRGDQYLFALGVLIFGWSLPLLVRGKARRVLVIVIAVQTPFVLLIAWSLGRSLPT